jgi:hypothetical protein
MRPLVERTTHRTLWAVATVLIVCLLAVNAQTQTVPYERTFPQSKAAVEKALSLLQTNLAGHLPTLDGFAKPGDHPLDRYQRGYYQTTVQVNPVQTGGSVVRVSTKVTAWYADPVASRSGYQLLVSNGRLESDLLDQLTEQLAKSSSIGHGPTEAVAVPSGSTDATPTAAPAVSSPATKFPTTERTFSSSSSQGLTSEHSNSQSLDPKNADKSTIALQKEAESLEETLRNQAHPKNLVAVKKSGTPVVGTPSLAAKPQFLASMHDEFEMLDFNADWVHVRVSGLSRGWIWRNSVEMPEGMRDTGPLVAPALAPAADLFHVMREEASTFPGDWAPLRNKNVKIISVQKVDENAKDAGSGARLEYAKFLLEKGFKEIAQKPQDLAGIVIIFDSADGGMIAVTSAALQQWKAGTLSDAALWHKCFFDPPETFDSAGSSASQ